MKSGSYRLFVGGESIVKLSQEEALDNQIAQLTAKTNKTPSEVRALFDLHVKKLHLLEELESGDLGKIYRHFGHLCELSPYLSDRDDEDLRAIIQYGFNLLDENWQANRSGLIDYLVTVIQAVQKASADESKKLLEAMYHSINYCNSLEKNIELCQRYIELIRRLPYTAHADKDSIWKNLATCYIELSSYCFEQEAFSVVQFANQSAVMCLGQIRHKAKVDIHFIGLAYRLIGDYYVSQQKEAWCDLNISPDMLGAFRALCAWLHISESTDEEKLVEQVSAYVEFLEVWKDAFLKSQKETEFLNEMTHIFSILADDDQAGAKELVERVDSMHDKIRQSVRFPTQFPYAQVWRYSMLLLKKIAQDLDLKLFSSLKQEQEIFERELDYFASINAASNYQLAMSIMNHTFESEVSAQFGLINKVPQVSEQLPSVPEEFKESSPYLRGRHILEQKEFSLRGTSLTIATLLKQMREHLVAAKSEQSATQLRQEALDIFILLEIRLIPVNKHACYLELRCFLVFAELRKVTYPVERF